MDGVPTLLLVVTAAIAGIGCLYLVLAVWYAFASYQWPTAEATILDSALTPSGGDSSGYHFSVSYTFSVRGQKVTGDTLQFGHAFESVNTDTGRKLVSAYPVGATVPVYHHPRYLHTCTLRPGTRPALIVILLMVLALLVFLVNYIAERLATQ